MRNVFPFFLTKLTVLALVAVLAGCGGGEGGGSDQNQSSSQKPDNSEGGQAAKPMEKPAEKFTSEMVKEAFEAAWEQLPDLYTKEELAKQRAEMLEPEMLQEIADDLNEDIVDGKVNVRTIKIDAITVEALTKAVVARLLEVKKEGDKKRVAVKIAFNSGYLARCLLDCSVDLEYTFPSSDKWCDAILRDASTLAVFYSPQHPDTPKLKESLPKPIPTKPEPAEPPAPTEESLDEPAEPPAPTEESVVGEPAPPAPVQEKPKPLPKGKQVSHYAMNKVMSGVDSTLDPEVILVFECDLGWNGAGGLEDALKYMDKFKLEKIAVATADGSTQFVTKEELKKLKWVPLE